MYSVPCFTTLNARQDVVDSLVKNELKYPLSTGNDKCVNMGQKHETEKLVHSDDASGRYCCRTLPVNLLKVINCNVGLTFFS
jgi:hypothetical protein